MGIKARNVMGINGNGKLPLSIFWSKISGNNRPGKDYNLQSGKGNAKRLE